jgi:translation elongation factor EF-1alpha
VKGFQPNSYAITSTDIQIGDVLLTIDDTKVSGKQFELALLTLKDKTGISGTGCTLTFQTIEEKLRLIRMNTIQKDSAFRNSQTSQMDIDGVNLSDEVHIYLNICTYI